MILKAKTLKTLKRIGLIYTKNYYQSKETDLKNTFLGLETFSGVLGTRLLCPHMASTPGIEPIPDPAHRPLFYHNCSVHTSRFFQMFSDAACKKIPDNEF